MPQQVTEVHKELIHYTTSAGLAGIITSGCLWATEATALNDTQETNLYLKSDEFNKLVNQSIIDFLKELQPDAVGKEPQELLFELLTKSISKVTTEFNQPYIFSLSSVTNDNIRNHGLLSQWRGYGSDGSYAIVFDTIDFEALLTEEANGHLYQFMYWGDVWYEQNEEQKETEEELKRAIKKFLNKNSPDGAEDIYEPITKLCCTAKHWGFHEEHEVRVVAIPPNGTTLESKEVSDNRTPRKIFVRSKNGMLIPYIELFSGNNKPLPIRRVIVGPHLSSGARKKTVETILKANGYHNVEVVISNIPYIGL